MTKGEKAWSFEAPSRHPSESQPGKTVGDDLCAPIKKDIPAPGLEVIFTIIFSY